VVGAGVSGWWVVGGWVGGLSSIAIGAGGLECTKTQCHDFFLLYCELRHGVKHTMIKKVHNSACVVSFVGFNMIIGALAPEGKRGHFRRHR